MKCDICKKTIEHIGGNEFLVIIKNEMIWGQQSIYPLETKRIILCSLGCLSVYIYREEIP